MSARANEIDPAPARADTSALVTITDLVKTFGEGEAETKVLRGLSLVLNSGEMAALLGPSGSGKSTLLTILGTLMRPTSGAHSMLGQDLAHANDAALTEFRNRHIGFVFQFHNLLPDFTALENVIFPTAVREGRETAAARARGRELLVRMGLEDRIDFLSTSLSGGQKQRVAVARALMNRPELVLADEPTGNLDRLSATQVMDLLAEINRQDGTTFLISTHDEKIAALCRRHIVVGEGLVTG
jgi:lipoprotein-releasing system ATP-binding protein